ncbi:16367_t:CDS:2, partial [Dentiscutata heterogama]
MSTTSILTRHRCTICNSKRTFKSKAGLQRHENLKHSDYKEIPIHILLVPEHELHHIKNVIVKELQNFVSLFGQYLTRYSICGGWYQCFFDGEEAIDQLSEILGDSQWAERNYGNRQISWIKLYESESDNIKETDQIASESKSKTKKKFYLKRGLFIEWRMKGFSDKAEHRCESGEVTFRFVVDQ